MLLESFNEQLLVRLEEKYVDGIPTVKKDANGKIRPKRQFKKPSKFGDEKSQEVERAKEFKSFFGGDKQRITHKNKEWYVTFSVHAMSRYIERDAKLDKKYLEDLLIKMIKVLQFKEKNKLFLVYSVSLKRAMVVTKKADDSFTVVTVYPEGENVQSKNTQKVLIENLFEVIIDEYLEIE